MAIELEGGSRVCSLKEGQPYQEDLLRAFAHFGRSTGAAAISLRVLELAPGRSPLLGGAACDEVLYVLDGHGRLSVDGLAYSIEPDTGFYVPPHARFTLDNLGQGALTVVSSRCPDPSITSEAGQARGSAAPLVVRLADRAPEVTGDRWYRTMIDGRAGSAQVTQFVGSIPKGRAPDHFHEYEEVLCILKGQGRMWSGTSNTQIEAGSCIYLPRRQVHCVENTGSGELMLLGVFYPAGSPAVRYSTD